MIGDNIWRMLLSGFLSALDAMEALDHCCNLITRDRYRIVKVTTTVKREVETI